MIIARRQRPACGFKVSLPFEGLSALLCRGQRSIQKSPRVISSVAQSLYEHYVAAPRFVLDDRRMQLV
jgi:hypothetical protein